MKINVISAYKIDIDVHSTPKQETFVSFQCNVLEIPTVDANFVSFKSQASEYNGKVHTEVPITCISPVTNVRIFSKLQKNNRIDIMGNLIKNDKENIVVSIAYVVYANINNFSAFNKKDLSKIPWLNKYK